MIEATVWARQIERYRTTYERAVQRRGKKIGRLVVARLLLRSIYKVLRDGVEFQAVAEAGKAYDHYRERFRKTFEDAGESVEKAADRMSDWLQGHR